MTLPTAPIARPLAPMSNPPTAPFAVPTRAHALDRAPGWTHEASIAFARSPAMQPAHLVGEIPQSTTYRATLSMAQLGHLDLTVTDGPSLTAIRLHCGSDASYAWLASNRRLLECRLAQAFGRASQIELVRACME